MEKACTAWIRKLLQTSDINTDEEQIEVYVYGLLTYIYAAIPLLALFILLILFDSQLGCIGYCRLVVAFPCYYQGIF